MKASEMRGRGAADLRRELEALQRQLFELKFRWQAEEHPDTNTPMRLKRDIARYKTVLREMELQADAKQG
jgi:large subunit ribosomal protein L29